MNKIDKKELKKIFNKMKTDRKKAVEELCNKYYNLIYKIAFSILKNKEDTEDAVQNFITKIYSIDASKLPTDKEATWMYAVVKNEALEIIRRKNKELNICKENIYEIQDENDEIEQILDKENFNKLIGKLNDKEKEIVTLKIVSDLSFNQISNLLEQPESTIKWKYYKAVYKIKLLLGNIAMFIITFVTGLSAITKNLKKGSSMEKNIVLDNEEIDNNYREEANRIEKENSLNLSKNTDKIENATGMGEPLADNTENQKQNNLANENIDNQANKNNQDIDNETYKNNQENINNEQSATNNETIASDTPQINYLNYARIGTLCISAIFLVVIIYIISFSKFKLKPKHKTSK